MGRARKAAGATLINVHKALARVLLIKAFLSAKELAGSFKSGRRLSK
jgi:hypothetical protein